MRRFITLLLTLLLVFSLFIPTFAAEKETEELVIVTEPEPLDPKVEAMIAWAMETAADDTHGYSQNNRYGPDYDCTSFVCTALMEGGFALEHYLSTRGMARELPALGFAVYRKGETEPQRGDILVELGVHAEICMGNGTCVGAHQDYGHSRSGDRSGHEIEYRTPESEKKCWFCKKAQYHYIIRYEGLEILAAQRQQIEELRLLDALLLEENPLFLQ